MCNFNQDNSIALFLKPTGTYTFKTTDKENFWPGEYKFLFTGKNAKGETSYPVAQMGFTLELGDPCYLQNV